MHQQSVALTFLSSITPLEPGPDRAAVERFFGTAVPLEEREHHWRAIAARYRLEGGRRDVRAVAFDYLLSMGLLKAPVLVEEASLEQAERLAYRDGLTGLHNYAYFEQQLELETARARRYGTRLCLVLVDLDGFKSVNDRFGHAAGNEVLATAATLLRDALREGDVVARLGGDEFGLLLHQADLVTGLRIAERKRGAIEAWFRRGLGVTASFGVAELGDDGGLFAAADEALYQSKRRGRNRVSLSRARSAAAG